MFPAETPMTNLLLTMLDKVGVQAEKLGDRKAGKSANRATGGCMRRRGSRRLKPALYGCHGDGVERRL